MELFISKIYLFVIFWSTVRFYFLFYINVSVEVPYGPIFGDNDLVKNEEIRQIGYQYFETIIKWNRFFNVNFKQWFDIEIDLSLSLFSDCYFFDDIFARIVSKGFFIAVLKRSCIKKAVDLLFLHSFYNLHHYIINNR